MMGLPKLGEQILKESYTHSEIEKMPGQVKILVNYDSIDLYADHFMDNILIKEGVRIDPKSLLPQFICKVLHNIKEEAKPNIYSAIEKMNEKTDGVIFTSSSEDDYYVTMNAKSFADKKITDEIIKSFREIEVIVNLQSQLLNKDT